MSTARTLGEQAYHAGRPCVPAQDGSIMSIIQRANETAAFFGQPAPDALPTLAEWRAGWQSAQGWAALAARQASAAVLTFA